MSATQGQNAIESLQDWTCELLIKNQRLRIALIELKASGILSGSVNSISLRF
jgi:hypothetical protein